MTERSTRAGKGRGRKPSDAPGPASRRRPRAARPVRGVLDRARVIDAALRVLARERLDGFSMRKLAAELGATPMAVYRYFRDKDALLDALVDAVFDGMEIPREGGAGDWRGRAKRLAHAYRARLAAHPEIAARVLRRAVASPAALRGFEAALSALRETGLPDAEVVRGVDAITGYVLGFSAIEHARRPERAAGRSFRALAPLFRALPAREFPALSSLAPHLGDFDEALFEYGLELMLHGIEARIARRAPGPGGRRRAPVRR